MNGRALADLVARPRLGLFDVSSQLTRFVTTTWDVAPDALAAHLPDTLSVDAFTLDDGRERAFVSAVSFLNVGFHVGFAPWLKLTTPQTNYRAYVRRGAQRAVWFFGTSLGTRWGLLVPRTLWRLPWAHVTGDTDATWDGDALVSLRWRGDGEHGEERLEIEGTGEPMGRLDGFPDLETTQLVLTHPMVGYLRRRGGGPVVTYGVWHAPLELERCRALEARFELFERLGLVEPGAPPHSVLAQRRTHYLIDLPPRRVRW